ncbi:hypothetical protein RRG08_039097 [Elysia crispata]|uniref:Chorein N-terminal domain-containing protein n=1 Tax=Elysia crispata TaxID=231223 RepID=A0AAE0ZMV1_9GAST|nr:hypothetical protein RRG08_039097 [Elysia crispata]
MFKLESYITPLLMGYLDKYVKLRQEDFQLSLWGGDAVLNNLDLRLDELEKVVQLPVMFQSGHIHELRLHVPWTKLGSEPVVITINTVECIVKVRDTAYETGSSGKSASSPGKASQQRQKAKRRAQPTEDLPPGYLQSIVNRIVNNVTFIMNNLILKFVEDDIVLSVNIKSAECYSVDKEWNRAFVDLTPHDLALRKIINFADLTVCLDKTNASGHIESYQEPMAYRCAVTCRFHMEYDSVTAKFPRTSRFNLYCDTLQLTLTDTQLPMFVRLVQLCIAMYYGLLDIPAPPTPQSSSVDAAAAVMIEEGEELAEFSGSAEGQEEDDQGWASWAWSYVPQLLPTEEEEAELRMQETDERLRRERAAPHILSLGFYIHNGTILFKLTEKSRDSHDLPHKKMVFHPFLKLDIEGAGTEVLLQGLEFFSVQCGFTAFRLSTCGESIKTEGCNTLLRGGEPLDQKIGLDYLSNSLFDDMSWENRGQRTQHIVDGDQHRQVFTEQYALQRFGAFWLDQLYTMEKQEKFWAGSNSSETNGSDSVFMKEYSTLRFLLGNTHLQFTSTFHHRIAKLLACAANHHYQPYGSGRSDPQSSPDERPQPSEEQVQSLEDFIPTNILHFMLINPTVTIVTAEYAYSDVAKKNFKSREKKKRESSSKAGTQKQHQAPASSSSQGSSSSTSLPALTLTASRFDLQVTRPMYPGRLVKLVTSIAGPSSNLLHHCHSHTQIKLFSLQGGLQRCEFDQSLSHTLTVLPPCSFALYSRSLQLPKLWTNSSLSLNEWMYEVPNVSVNVSKASILMVCRIVSSWLSPSSPSSIYAKETRSAEHNYQQQLMSSDSLLDDLFPISGETTHQTFPMLELGLCGLEFKSCKSKLVDAFSGSLSSVHILLYTPGIGGKMSAIPILYGPTDTSNICDTKFFTAPTLEPSSVRSDCITATVQIPKHTSVSEAQALTLVDCQGLCVWLDPSLISWFHYCPQPRPGHSSSADQPPVTLDLSLAQMTSPLNAVSQASVHSTSSPSHQGGHSRQQTSTSHHHVPPSPRHADLSTEGEKTESKANKTDGSAALGHSLAKWFPLIRLLHLQVDTKPCAIFLPKASIPMCETSPDILTHVHQARQQGRLSDTLVICLPSMAVSSTMTKPLSVVQDLPVTSIHGSLIGEKLPWTVKIKSTSMYTLLSASAEPSHLLHPLDIVSTVAVTCKYNPPTSEIISSLALCLHVDVGSPQFDLTATQLQLCSISAAMVNSITGNALSLAEECTKYFASPPTSLDASDRRKVSQSDSIGQSQPFAPASQTKTATSTGKREMRESEEATETNPTTDISEDFSHEGSPLHESLIDETGDLNQGIKLSLWMQLMVPSAVASVYNHCPLSGKEHGLSLSLDHLDVSLDSQHIYTKVKLALGSIGIQHSTKNDSGKWSWTDPEGIVMSCRRQLPRHLSTVTTRLWRIDSHASHHGPVFPQHHMGVVGPGSSGGGSKKNSSTAISVTFTTALCKNVKRRLRKANVELPVVTEMDTFGTTSFAASMGPVHRDLHSSSPETDAAGVGMGDQQENLDLYFHRYLSEICIKTEPVDFVFKPEFMSVISSLTIGNGSSSLSHLPPSQDEAKIKNLMESPGFERSSRRIKSRTGGQVEQGVGFPNIPLIYADLGMIRVFIPKSQNLFGSVKKEDKPLQSSSSSADSKDLSSSTVIDIEEDALHVNEECNRTDTSKPVESPNARTETEVCSTLNHTMLVMQMNGCVVQPHADNPLPRVAQERDLFQRAIQSGMTQQPGSVVEDRQYQLNVRGIALSTGIWEHLVLEAEEAERRKSPMGSQVQIPALDWNTFLMDSPGPEKKEVKLIPVASPFDVCVVVAPPITYVKQNLSEGECSAPIPVCGLTSEMNVTSDLDLYLSSNQVKLLVEMVDQFGQAASANKTSHKMQALRRLSHSTIKSGPFDKTGSQDMAAAEGLGLPGMHGPGENPSVDRGRGTHGQAGVGVDSGVESDVSALTFDYRKGKTFATETMAPGAMKSASGDNAKGSGRKGSFQAAQNPDQSLGVRTCGDHKSLTAAVPDGEGLFASTPPLDILLTAGRISCTVYTHKILEEDFTIQLPMFGDHRSSASPSAATKTRTPVCDQAGGSVKDNLTFMLSKKPVIHRDNDDEGIARSEDEDEGVEEEMLDGGFTSFNFMKPQPEDNGGKKVIAAGSVSVVPFVYLFVTQPHCIISNHRNSGSRNTRHQHHLGGDASSLSAIADNKSEKKLEVSCYDVLVKGASEKHISAVDEYHVIPVCADFNVHWLETRPGEPDSHTGIPPSLLTAQLVQKAHMPGVIKFHLERPMRLKASQLAVEQINSFCSDLLSTFRPSLAKPERPEEGSSQQSSKTKIKKGNTDMFSLAERLELKTSQVVIDLDLDSSGDSDSTDSDKIGSSFSAGLVLSLEGISAQLEILDTLSEQHMCVRGLLQLKDALAKICFNKHKCRPLVGPFSVGVDASLTWIPVSSNVSIPQVVAAIDSSVIRANFGQEHLFCITNLLSQLNQLSQKILKNNKGKSNSYPETSKVKTEREEPALPLQQPENTMAAPYALDFSQDDLRSGNFQFIESQNTPNLQPEPYEIIFSGGDPAKNEGSGMTWCYPHPRVLTGITLNPVPFCLSTTAPDEGSFAVIPCELQYWSELCSQFVMLIKIHLSENEPVKVSFPDPTRPGSRSDLVASRLWRVVLGTSSVSASGPESPAVLPASLAACMCVNSALVPALVPSLHLSLAVPGLELHASHHLQYNGSLLPEKLSLYQACPETVEEQIFAVARVRDIGGSLLHLAGCGSRSSVKVSGEASLNVLEYGHLTMEEVLSPACITVTADLDTRTKDPNFDVYVHSDRVRVNMGRSVVHSLHSSVAAWTTFNPRGTGPHLVFSHIIICNNTANTIRFGQAGTNENIVLNSREMCGYSWRSEACAELLHLCMDVPSWKWTEPFPVNGGGESGSNRRAPGSIVRRVVTQDQSWVVIIRVRHLSSLQTQVTICGQLLVSNRLSQPISMRLSSSHCDDKRGGSVIGKTILAAPGSPHHHRVFTLQPGASLPSLVENEVMASPVQFRLAGHHTSWSHDIYLSGDKMKDNQLVKIPLPDKTSYFHVWCRILCQHFQGIPQKLVMLTPLYVVRTHLPRPLHIHVDSPKAKSSQEIQVASQGREFQLHCQGGDITHHMGFRLGANMQLSSPAVVLSTGLIEQLEREIKPGPPDLEQLCELQVNTTCLSWPYLGEDGKLLLDADLGDAHSNLLPSQVCSPSSTSDQGVTSSYADLELDLEPQPSVDLQVRLSEYIPGCDTLLVEVAPSCLLHNGTDMDLALASEDEDENLRWTVRPGQTMAPPSPKTNLKIAVKYQNVKSEEKTIPVSMEASDYRRYNDDLGKVLFLDSFVHVSFQLFQHDKERMEMAFLSVSSDLKHGIRIICIRERFALANKTDLDLDSKLLALPLSLNPICMSETAGTRVTCPGKQTSKRKKDEDHSTNDWKQESIPLFRWSVLDQKAENPRPKIEGSEDQQTFVCYIALSKVNVSDQISSTSQDWQWSQPVRLVSSKDSRRTTTSIPDFYELSSSAVEENKFHSSDLQDNSATLLQQRHVHSEPLLSSMAITHAMCVTSQQVKGVTHLALSQDIAPVFVVENLCPFALQFGQACDLPGINGAVIQEQVELVNDLPWVPSHGWCHYTPPSTNAEFVNRESLAIPKLFFRACKLPKTASNSDSGSSEWSSPIQTSGNTDAFIQLRGFCDLKVAIETVGMVTHLVIRPVSKAEVSAREIRSRLKGSRSDHIAVTGASGGDELRGKFGAAVVKWQKDLPEDEAQESDASGSDLTQHETSSFASLSRASEALAKALKSAPSTFSASDEGNKDSSSNSSSATGRRRRRASSSAATANIARFSELYKKNKKSNKLSVCVGVFCGNFSLQILDESMLGGHLSPLMTIHLKEMFFASFPVATKPGSMCAETSFALSVGNVQVDNQRFGVGTYDFPVVFLPQSASGESFPPANSSQSSLFSEGVSILEIHAIMKSKAFSHTRIVTFDDPMWQQSGIDSVDVSFKPFSVYVDDTFIYRVLEEIEAFSPSRLTSAREFMTSKAAHQEDQGGGVSRKLPQAVELNSLVLSRPMRVKHLSIQPIKMLLSVHASMRLFLASDHTPLNLAQFQRENVFSTTQRLLHALTVHYASAAIFRAGIVVGSLEILGNPTGLVRSIGTGVSDLISLPYSGLTRGPSAFIYGLSRGIGSLFRNVSAGTITSVTNLASSISRNMDRLSLDTGHRQRQEESRRHRPSGLADGLRQGLTGFGISLLGAVAGLADHPMQTLLGPEAGAGVLEERRGSSPTSTASDIMTGVGKGLVGVLTKPIGGAAELVSQTGQGLLHGTGLGQVPNRLETAEAWTRLDLPDSVFKCVKKALPSLPSTSLVLSMPAVTFDPARQELLVQLLLTPDVLVVVTQEDAADGQTIQNQQQQQQHCQDLHQVFTLAELECGRGGNGNIHHDGKTASPHPKSERETGVLVVCWQDQVFRSSRAVEDGHNSSKDRVAAFIDNLTGQGAAPTQHLSFPDEPQPIESAAIDPSDQGREFDSCMEHNRENNGKAKLKSQASNSTEDDNPTWEFLLDVDQLELFLSTFQLAKNKLQGKGFPV